MKSLQNKKEMPKKEKKKQGLTPKQNVSRKNREFVVITYLFLAVFVFMMGYFVYYQVVLSEDFISSTYNTRQDLFARTVTRGDILSADGYVLAETIETEDGEETRYYPYGDLFAHVVGYSINGKSGIESMTNFNLLRSHTFFLDKIINELQGEKNPGDNVITTLNFNLQETAYESLGHYDGAIIVMEPSTGKILAMVSKPDYNPNNIADDWELLTAADNESTVLVNRATQGLYPPGSIFKIFTTLEYIHENNDYDEFLYDCDGSFTSDNSTIHCYRNKKHGEETLLEAFTDSCNSAYSSLGLTLDIDQFASLCDGMLFNVDLPTRFESSKSSFALENDAKDSEIMATAIGQGNTLVTPLHMALITSAIANDGVLMNPYVIDYTENVDGVLVDTYEASEFGPLLSAEDAKILQEYMMAVVADGTGDKLSNQSYTAAGKTGTAEFSTSSDSAHSWFIGYAHQDGYEDIAVTVIVEDSGAGSEYAVPIAKKIFDAYYSN